jgi:hypothetical protein
MGKIWEFNEYKLNSFEIQIIKYFMRKRNSISADEIQIKIHNTQHIWKLNMKINAPDSRFEDATIWKLCKISSQLT